MVAMIYDRILSLVIHPQLLTMLKTTATMLLSCCCCWKARHIIASLLHRRQINDAQFALSWRLACRKSSVAQRKAARKRGVGSIWGMEHGGTDIWGKMTVKAARPFVVRRWENVWYGCHAVGEASSSTAACCRGRALSSIRCSCCSHWRMDVWLLVRQSACLSVYLSIY